MSPGRATRNDDEVRVAAVFLDMGFHPGNRLFDVNNLRGVGVPRRQPVIDRHPDPTQLYHAVQQWLSLMRLVAHHPGAAVHMQQYRSSRSLSHGGVDVQEPPLACSGITQIAHIAHARATKTKRPQPLLAMNLFGQLGPPRLWNLIQEICAKRNTQRPVKSRAGIKAVPEGPRQQTPGRQKAGQSKGKARCPRADPQHAECDKNHL